LDNNIFNGKAMLVVIAYVINFYKYIYIYKKKKVNLLAPRSLPDFTKKTMSFSFYTWNC